MNRWKGLLILGGFLMALIFSISYATAQKGKPSEPSSCGWQPVVTPAVPGYPALYGVDAISENDIWAGGSMTAQNGSVHPLLEHWNGGMWTVAPTPYPGAMYTGIRDLSAASSTDIWAVGNERNGPASNIYILHWDGSQWRRSYVDNIGTQENSLEGINALTSTDAWAVGFYSNSDNVRHNLTLHWDGTSWTHVSAPDLGTGSNNLNDVIAIAPDDVWTVGTATIQTYQGAATSLHWNGTAWQLIDIPLVSSDTTILYGITAVSATDIWAVGTINHYSYVEQDGYIIHWNGSTWEQVNAPNPGSGDTRYLFDVSAGSANNIWAVGRSDCSSYNAEVPYKLHFDGVEWHFMGDCGQQGGTYSLSGVDVIAPDNVWSVGWSRITVNDQLIEQYTCNLTTTPTPSPTITRLPTPTTCTVEYSDVPAGSTFYSAIYSLTQWGIVSGYEDGTFRPGVTVTRGQLAKIVAISLQIVGNYHVSTFTDVPLGSTYHQYIESMYQFHYLMGYTDPAHCPTGVPCFLPNNPITRGQMAKIIAEAAEYDDYITGQTFSDVPTNSLYYKYIEELYLHHLVSGFDDGTFRPESTTSRGQTSKVVACGFFYICH